MSDTTSTSTSHAHAHAHLDGTSTAHVDDTSGHVLHGDAAQDPVSGGKAPSLRARMATATDEPEDDTEGHRLIAQATGEPEDDAEGHRLIAQATDEPEDDTEGHLRRF